MVFLGRLPLVVFGTYFALSTITFISYGLDKMAARNKRTRTKESRLHLLAIVGGWPGALLAQKILRHKSSKERFRTVFWMTVFSNCLLLAWLLTSSDTILHHFLFSLTPAWVLTVAS
jgi:uncharacterized membrane protein YsdA (DUF1294 family)